MTGKQFILTEWAAKIIADELNVKEVIHDVGRMRVIFDRDGYRIIENPELGSGR